ncbi:MAG: ISKra4 family transposase [Mycobacteriales bacterium]
MDAPVAAAAAFASSCEQFQQVVGFLGGEAAAGLTHAELETQLGEAGRNLLRQLYQDHLALRAHQEVRSAGVIDSAGTPRGAVEAGHTRPLVTVFGPVKVARLAYRRKGQANLYPADAALNLPVESHSHGLRELTALEASRDSYEATGEAIRRYTGVHVPKRQLIELARAAAVDFEAYYAAAGRPATAVGDVLCISLDGKGVVMRPDALREATAKAAAQATHKMKTRLSKGEKCGRKRMAELGTVFDVTPAVRSPADILPTTAVERAAVRPGPDPAHKWLTASVVDDLATVVRKVFDEAERRDPGHQRRWVVLVDGANHQLDRVKAEAKARKIELVVICDFVHVLEYLWRAAWAFFAEGDPAAEVWVRQKARAVLAGDAATVAASIRRKATCLGLTGNTRKQADTTADYLLRKQRYLDYPTALAQGWPIATGIIEGACRHLVSDRLDRTGARWGLAGAEAILKLRALRSNGDFWVSGCFRGSISGAPG